MFWVGQTWKEVWHVDMQWNWCKGQKKVANHWFITPSPPPKVMGGYVFAGVSRYIGRYVCEQLPGANSSPIVTKLCLSYPWPQETRWLHFGRSKVKFSGGVMCSTERPSPYCQWWIVWIFSADGFHVAVDWTRAIFRSETNLSVCFLYLHF